MTRSRAPWGAVFAAMTTLTAATTIGCGSGSVAPALPPPTKTTTAPAPPPSPGPGVPDPGVDPFTARPSTPPRRLRSRRFQLSFPLPDLERWSLAPVEGRSRFSTLRHAPTESEITLGRWRSTTNANRRRCAEEAFRWRALPGPVAAIDEAGRVDAPTGYDTAVAVGSRPDRGDSISGYALAFGAQGRTCVAFVFTTVARGDDAEARVGSRLATIRSIVLPGLRLRDDRDVAR
ncbi:MAG: hypothetical protein AAF715_27885 [Myxococcota bacterium]